MRGEDLAKHVAATNKKGVVGNKGKNAPIKASATKNIPDIFNNIKPPRLDIAIYLFY
jgi:hypothetical protein